MANVFLFLEVQRSDPGNKPAFIRVSEFGFRPGPADWFGAAEVSTDDGGRVVAPEQAEFPLQTSKAKIFAGGDMVRGSDLAVTANYEGREAAEGILDFLQV